MIYPQTRIFQVGEQDRQIGPTSPATRQRVLDAAGKLSFN